MTQQPIVCFPAAGSPLGLGSRHIPIDNRVDLVDVDVEHVGVGVHDERLDRLALLPGVDGTVGDPEASCELGLAEPLGLSEFLQALADELAEAVTQ